MSDSNDLRQAGTAAKRAHDKKAKWAHGGRPGAHIAPAFQGAPLTRPVPRLHSMKFTRVLQLDHKSKANQLSTDAKMVLRHDIREALDSGASSDTSSGEEVEDPAAAQQIIAASATEHGGRADSLEPYEVSGQTILSDAINKAVERFEVRETEKLVKEYEIVTRESEMAMGYLADEDDFEVVDHGRL